MMSREELKRRIGELAELVMHEENREKLLEYLVELDKLIEQYRSPPTRRSSFADDAERMYKPSNIDIEWARSMMKMIKQDGLMVFPAANLHYRVDHANKMLTLMNVDQLLHFDSFVTHLQTIATFRRIEYAVIELEPNDKG